MVTLHRNALVNYTGICTNGEIELFHVSSVMIWIFPILYLRSKRQIIINSIVIIVSSLVIYLLNFNGGSLHYLTNKNEYVSLLGNENIKINKEDNIAYNEIEEILINNNYNKNDFLVCLSNMPGLVYILDAKSPITQVFHRESSRVCSKLNILKNEMATFIIVENNLPNTTFDCLSNTLGFPSSYILIGKNYLPSTGQNLKIYKRKNLILNQ